MKKIKIENIDNLTSLKESFNEVVDKHIENFKLQENINKINDLSFVELKTILESISDKLYCSENGKKLLAKCVKTICENQETKDEYILMTNLKTPKNVNDSKLYLSESISLVGKRDESFQKQVNQVASLLQESLKELKLTSSEIESLISNAKTNLNESLNFLIENKKTVKNINTYLNHFNVVESHITNVNKNETIQENVKPASELIADFNDLCANMESWESNAIKDMSLAIMENKSMEVLFNEYKSSCIDILNESIENENADIETISRLQVMKEKLEEKQYSEETLNEDLFKLSELKETLL